MKELFEVCYANGEVYKEVFDHDSGVRKSNRLLEESTYHFNAEKEGAFNVVSVKRNNTSTHIKRYKPSTDLYTFCGVSPAEECVDLSSYDLTDLVELYIGIGVDDTNKYDLFFTVRDSRNLKDIADYYDLLFPIPEEENDMDSSPIHWQGYALKTGMERIRKGSTDNIDNFKIGSVKFKNNIANTLKMYKSNLKGEEYAGSN